MSPTGKAYLCVSQSNPNMRSSNVEIRAYSVYMYIHIYICITHAIPKPRKLCGEALAEESSIQGFECPDPKNVNPIPDTLHPVSALELVAVYLIRLRLGIEFKICGTSVCTM